MKISVFNSLTLDGVMQGPGGVDEDTRGGFTKGGWAHRYHDPVMMEVAGEGMAKAGPILFGRRTYEQFHSFWLNQPEGLGSGELIRSLMPHGLIDSYTLQVHPLVLGSGQRLFPTGFDATLRLVNSVPTTTGVIIATYEPA